MKLKKILSLAIISLFIMTGLVLADSSWAYENVTILGPRMGPKGQTPPVEVIKVTVGSEDDAIAVGDVVTWRIEPEITDGNALGFAVEKCRRGSSEATSTSEAGHGPYAGVMVTTATSNDQGGGGGWTNANPLTPDSSIGYMALRGFVDAKIDDSEATLGEHLVLNGHRTAGSFVTEDNVKTGRGMSEDIGYLMEDTDSDGLMKVWLR